jgi:pimeloyl-ACP methyl ester carboxylesterase
MVAAATVTRLEVLGTALRVAQLGAGRDLLLIHGSPGSLEDWQPIVDRLAGSFRVTAYDRPGHGESAARLKVGVAENAEVAAALIEILRLEQVTVVGHSYGGAVALALAVAQPRQVEAYVSVGGALLHARGERIEASFRALALPLLGPALARLAPHAGAGQLEQGVRRAFKPNLDAIPSGFLERARALWLSPKVARTTARERVGIGPEQERGLIARYPTIARPLLCVHGEADRIVPPRQSVEVSRMVPGAELRLLPDVGHYVQYACPDELAALLSGVSRGA